MRPTMLRAAGPACASAVLTLAAVTLVHPSATRLHTWPWALVAQLLWLAPLVALVVGIWREPAWRLPSPTVLAGTALLALAAAASAASSPFAAATLPRVWPTFGGLALFLLLFHWLSEPVASGNRAALLARTFAWLGGLVMLVAFVVWWNAEWPLPWGSRNAAPFGHSTYTAGAVVLIVPWLGFAAVRSSGAARAAAFGLTALSLVVLASTSSRGGVLGLAVVAAIFAIAVLTSGGWSRPRKIAVLLGLLAGTALLVASNPRLRELVVHRRWGDVAEESNTQRRAMLEAGVQLGAKRPVLGWGPGSIPLAYPLVRARLDHGVENILQLHATPLQLWATLGAAGLAAAALLLAGVSRSLVQPRRSPVALVAGATLAGYAAFALTDHQLDLPFFVACVAADAALLCAAAPPPTPPRSRAGRRAAALALVALAALAVPATVRDLRARFHYQTALDELAAGRIAAARAALERATAAAPHDPYFAHADAALLLDARAKTPDPTRQRALTREAVARLEAALATAAHQEFAHFNLGWLLLDLDQPADAARHFISAARLVPDKGGVYLGLGLALLAAERPADAVRAFALEWLNDPRSATSPAWETPLLAPHAPAIHAEALRLLAPLRAQTPAATVVEGWIQWTRGNPSPPADLRPHNAASRAFLAAQPRIAARAPLDASTAAFAWAQAYAPWRESVAPAAASPDAPSRAPGFAGCTDDPRFAAALTRRARSWPDDFRAFLTAPAGDDPALVLTFQRQRSGYGVLARHPAGPPLTDAYIVQENRVTSTFASELFPRKGTLPGRFLLALLPDAPR